MISFVELFIIIMMVVIVIFYIKKQYAEVAYVTSSVDGRDYLVRMLSDSQQAADLIASIVVDLTKLIHTLMTKYPENPDIRRLYENFNPDNISEGSSEHGYTSYSLNKGEKIILCIRQKEDNALVDKNTLLYVSIHELAHLMTDEVGHTPTFWENFKFILSEAVTLGIYTKVDYAAEPKKYCGIKISSTIL